MTRKFKQLTVVDRMAIGFLLAQNISQSEIARRLKVHRSTVSREIKRNIDPNWGYHAMIAQEQTNQRMYFNKQCKLDIHTALRDYVIEKLKEGWSPKQIVGRLNYLGSPQMICHETIYAYIYSTEGKKLKLYKYLRQHKPKRRPKISRKKRAPIANRTMIANRPEAINNRSEFGHWECDLMLFKRPRKINLITLRERKSRLVIAIKNPERKSLTTMNNIIEMIKKQYDFPIKSITFDNGPEFAAHQYLSQALNCKAYFCEPYKPYQKGAIENANQMLRYLFPRDFEIESCEQSFIDKQVDLLNNRPMACLGYKTPEQAFRDERH